MKSADSSHGSQGDQNGPDDTVATDAAAGGDGDGEDGASDQIRSVLNISNSCK